MRLKLYFILACCGLAVSAGAASLPLDEVVLEDAQSGCRVRYLTAKNTRGWSIDTAGKTCAGGGWLDGRADVRVFDAFVRPQQVLSGSFTQGYWTGEGAVDGADVQRLSFEPGEQSLIYPLASGAPGLALRGRADARSENGIYPAFDACRPAQVFILTADMDAFIHAGRREKLFADIVRKMRAVCPELTTIALTGVRDKITDAPVFRADLDVAAGTSDIRQMPGRPPAAPEEDASPPETAEPFVSSVAALMTTSRILKKPVFGTAVVHIGPVGPDGAAQ
ncbi:MAG: hypothetical protein PHX68_05100, partial [Alphaproteobacteria bacterium]|nr:hypothetical protein [Alphaproteobacteria bacterium]